jgi:hypothetical protein
VISTLLFGVWNRPNPIPHSVIRSAISTIVGCSGSKASEASPAARVARPRPPNRPGSWRSASRPAIGATMATASGPERVNDNETAGVVN